MDIVDRIGAVAALHGDRVAHRHRDVTLSYSHLWTASQALAARIAAMLPDDGSPVVVYGHKESSMLVAFLGAVRAAHPYIPIDASWPADRIVSVITESRAELVIAVRPLPEGVDTRAAVIDGSGLAHGEPAVAAEASRQLGPGDPYYVIYTSGSTGHPKGVQITAGALKRFVDWALSLAEFGGSPDERPEVWLNQAPFSFDLSVMDLYGALASGATLHSIDAATVGNPRALHEDLAASDLTIWVSTPSFADLCLADHAFDASLLPRLRLFLFCGETLPPTTAAALMQRFPDAQVVNTYGPTESTVAVTSVLIGPQHLDGTALPVGVAKPGTTILIRDEAGRAVPPNTPGEIVIAGDTVSIGYLHRTDLTAAAFTTVDLDGVPTPAYRTGDLGHLAPDGMLHFGGRLDGQVKLHGYRIELEDIENNLRRVDAVQQAAVLAIRNAEGTVTHLHAFVQLAPDGPALRDAQLVPRGAPQGTGQAHPVPRGAPQGTGGRVPEEGTERSDSPVSNRLPEEGTERSDSPVSKGSRVPEEGTERSDSPVSKGSPLAVATALKKQLRVYVPDYMVPKVITVVDRIPMTGNGKADRRALLATLHREPDAAR